MYFLHVDSHESDEEAVEISSSFPDIVTVESRIQDRVDETHPHVQRLIRAGYPEALSITAIRKFGTPNAAFDFLNMSGEEEEEKDGKNNSRKSPSPSVEDEKIQ